MEDRLVSISEGARIYNLTKGAVYQAVKLGRIKHTLVNGIKKIQLSDLKKYRKSRWNRPETQLIDGIPIVDNSKGMFYPYQVAELLGIDRQKIYHAIRKNRLKVNLVGLCYYLMIEDVMEFKEKYLSEKKVA